MKFMKKLTAVLAAALMCAPAAFAEKPISVLYNGIELKFNDVEPVIIEGRTMLPFRSVFEQMGAKVDYDDATRTAKANFRGNEISFSLDGSEIYSSVSEEPVYIMDVPPTIVEGRTLVPVRAVSEAGGLAVGWDAEERTVNVLDKKAIDEQLAQAPSVKSFKALMENPAKVYTQKESVALKSEAFSAEVQAQVTSDGEAKKINALMNIEADGVSLNGVSVDFILNSKAAYIRTDLMEKLAESYPDEADFKLMGTLVGGDKWFKADLGELETMLAGDNRGILSGAAEGAGAELMVDEYLGLISQSYVEAVDINDSDYVRMIPEMTQMSLSELSEILKVTQNADSTADVKLSVPVMDVETGKIIYTNYFNATYSSGVAVKAELAVKTEDIELQAKSEGRVGGLVEKVIFPKNYVNLVDVLYTLGN